MKLATWNVNSLSVRLPRLVDWLARTQPDVVVPAGDQARRREVPAAELEAPATSRLLRPEDVQRRRAARRASPAQDVARDIPGFGDEQKRVIAATVGGVRIVDFYLPNGQAVGLGEVRYKLDWCARGAAFSRASSPRIRRSWSLGDFNIAPEDRDVHDPGALARPGALHRRGAPDFRDWSALGLHDSFRLFEQPREDVQLVGLPQLAFPKNHGLRIDHILLAPALAARCTTLPHRPQRRARASGPSDHAPVIVEST